jgi:hypothetical protein
MKDEKESSGLHPSSFILHPSSFILPKGVATTKVSGPAGFPAGKVTSATSWVSPTLAGFLSGTGAAPLLRILAVTLAP